MPKLDELPKAFSQGPEQAADALLERRDGPWIDSFLARLLEARGGASLASALATWDLNQSEAARLFGVTRQAVSKWLITGVPGDRQDQVGDFLAATDVLVHYLKAERIPAVVRRPAGALDGKTLIECFTASSSRGLVQCRSMFDVNVLHA